MKKNKIILVIVTFIISIMLWNTVDATSTASIVASKTEVTVGDTFTVSINIAGSTYGSFGAYVNCSNKDVVGFSTSSGSATYNNNTGRLAWVDTAGASSATILTLTYNAKTEGESTFSLSNIEATDLEYEDINVTSYSTTVKVKAKEVEKPIEEQPIDEPIVTKSSNNYLKYIRLDVDGMSPTFNKYTNSYSITVPSTVNDIAVYTQVEDSKAYASVSGHKNLQIGTNEISIRVSAENGNARYYKIIVTKTDDAKKSDASLTSINLSNSKLRETFSPDVLDYTLEDVTNAQKIELEVFPTNEKATVNILGNENFIPGSNQIVIAVKAEDEITIKNYTLTFNYIPENLSVTPEIEPVVESNSYIRNPNNEFWQEIWQKCKNNALVILVYLFALVELFQIICLYKELRHVDRERKKEDTTKVKE